MPVTQNEDVHKSAEIFIKNVKNFIDKATSDVGTSAAKKQAILGAATGWFTGFLSARIGNVAATGFGGSVILTHIASQTEYININWDKIYDQFAKIKDGIRQIATGRPPNLSLKVERFVDRTLDTAEKSVRTHINGTKTWYWNSRGDNQYYATETHVFLALFVAGLAVGLICS